MKTPEMLKIWNIALVGPYGSGKTSLLESLLYQGGGLTRKGDVRSGSAVGDSSEESSSRQMSVHLNNASFNLKEGKVNILDCPGSIEFMQETYNALVGVDSAIVVCDPGSCKSPLLVPLLKFLDDWSIPHIIFINKIENDEHLDFADILQSLRIVSQRPILAHHYPLVTDSEVAGYFDLISNRVEAYPPHKQEDLKAIKADFSDVRMEVMENIADHDDKILSLLVEDKVPVEKELATSLAAELEKDLVVPVLVGSAERDLGIQALLNAIVSELPNSSVTAKRRGLPSDTDTPIFQVLKNTYTMQGGKQSCVRIWSGRIYEGQQIGETRVSGISRFTGLTAEHLSEAGTGDIVTLSRLEGLIAGDVVTASTSILDSLSLPRATLLSPVFCLAIGAERRNDEVKLTSALNRLVEEDPSLLWEQNTETREMLLWGQGEIHLMVAFERLRRKYNVPVHARQPAVPYKETIRKRANAVHGRYKHQTGGHGQFGDVYIDIEPLPRGEGYQFSENIVGGAIPKQFIPGVETGVREFLEHGSLGYPIVDVAVTLKDGTYHAVDSSELAFKLAARLAMQEGLSKCDPVLLEPILCVQLSTPSEYTSRVMSLISTRRGQMLGFDAHPELRGWDVISVNLPQVEMTDLIVELRSLTMGAGFFNWQTSHLQEVPEKVAEKTKINLKAHSARQGASL